MRRMTAILYAMTDDELDGDAKCFSNTDRIKRVAIGAGVHPVEVRQLLMMQDQFGGMVKKMSGASRTTNPHQMQQMHQMQKMQQQMAGSMGSNANMMEMMQNMLGQDTMNDLMAQAQQGKMPDMQQLMQKMMRGPK